MNLVAKREKLLRWLSIVPYAKHHRLKRSEYLEGSCKWLLGLEKYQQWKASSVSSVLWLRGTTGSGKSVLVSSVIEDLKTDQSANCAAAPIAYFYCSRNTAEPERSKPEEILRSILMQISSNTSALPIRQPVVKAYEAKTRYNYKPEPLSLEETIKILLEVFEEKPSHHYH
jgi:Cdc6-like AAA superfamily ATPase